MKANLLAAELTSVLFTILKNAFHLELRYLVRLEEEKGIHYN
jgi:hypothetical protein